MWVILPCAGLRDYQKINKKFEPVNCRVVVVLIEVLNGLRLEEGEGAVSVGRLSIGHRHCSRCFMDWV